MTTIEETGQEALRTRGGTRSRRAQGGRGGSWAADRATAVLRSVWLGPAVLMLLLGLWRINRVELWQDELVSLDVAHRSRTQILDLTQKVDGVHTFYYLFLHYWVSVFGDSLLALRAPAVLAMTGAAICVALTGRRLFGPQAGVAGGLLFALVPTMPRYAQEARSYAFIVFASALATLLFFRVLESPTWRRWIPYCLAASLLGVVHVIAMTLVAGHAVVLLASCCREIGVFGLLDSVKRPGSDDGPRERTRLSAPWRISRVRWLVLGFAASMVLALAAAWPVISLGRKQSGQQISWIPKLNGWGDVYQVWQQTVASVLFSALLLVAAGIGLVFARRQAVKMAIIVLLPMVIVWEASQGSVTYFFPKYLMFTIPAWAVLAGAGLAASRKLFVLAPALALAAAAAVPGQIAMHQPLSHMWYSYPSAPVLAPLDYQGAADVIAHGYQPGDAVVYARNPWWWMDDVGVKYYLPGSLQPRDVFLEHTAAQNNQLFSTECDPKSCLGTSPRLWIVTVGGHQNPVTALPGDQAAAIGKSYRLTSVTSVPGMTVGLVTRIG
ncbi:mannosyltransferase [Catenulispora sp. GAS73]|uniref:glycosyltransferase family 39 protein n=1 Tax=Catenulispora sp. GAS73 TaxID=3156269 RepID=UPI0035143C19